MRKLNAIFLRVPASVLESHSPAEFHSNPNQTHLNKLIKV